MVTTLPNSDAVMKKAPHRGGHQDPQKREDITDTTSKCALVLLTKESLIAPSSDEKVGVSPPASQHAAINACTDTLVSSGFTSIVLFSRSAVAAYSKWFLGVHEKMNARIFVPLFLNVADHPYRYIVAILLFSLIFPTLSVATGRFVVESDFDALIVPSGSFPLVQKAWLQRTFGLTTRSLAVIHADGNDVISEVAVHLAFDVAGVIPTLRDYDKVCRPDDKTHQTCFIQSISLFWNSREEFEKDLLVLEGDDEKQEYIVTKLSSLYYASGTPVTREAICGRSQVNTDNDLLSSAESFLISIEVYTHEDNQQVDFESDFGKKLNEISKQESYVGVVLDSFTATTLQEEILEVINKDIPLIAASIVTMSLFAALAMTRWRKNRNSHRFVTSKITLGLGATATVVLSAMTGYGVCTLCGYPLTFMSQMLPFVLFGIGIDDSFILVGAYYDTDPAVPLKERLASVAHTAAPSITATTLTDIVAFAFGASTTIPIVRWFCFYAAVCVFIDYIYQITFFIALLVIDHDREKKTRYDLCCCFKAVPTINNQVEEMENEIENSPNVSGSPKSGSWVKSYTTFLLKPVTKICVLILFTALFVGGAILATKVTVDIDEEELTPYDSQVDRFTQAFRDNFVQESGLFQAHIYYQDLDVSDPIVRQQMLSFRQELLNLGSDTYPPYPSFLEDFESYLFASPDDIAELSFAEQLDGFFNNSAYHSLYGETVIRDPISGEVERIKEGVAIARETSGVQNKIDLLSEQHAITVAHPLNKEVPTNSVGRAFLYEAKFPQFEHLRVLPRELALGMGLSILAVGIVSAVFMPHPTCVILSVLVIIMVDVEILAVLVLSGKTLESSSMVVLIMSIGLVADYCLHVVHAYLHVESNTRTERAKLALERVGVSVLLGGLSTFLGVTFLAFSSGPIFFRFFVLFSAMAGLGITHGLIFLPVVLSYIGPDTFL